MIRWGILGCGAVAEKKSGPALQRVAGSAIHAVMRRDVAKAQDYARRFGVPRWYDDADALIHDHAVDAVYIATPPGTHAEYALRVCAAGKPAYVEKPLARNATETAWVVDAFRQAQLPLFVAFYRRALPRFLHIRRLLEAGELGIIQAVTVDYQRPMPDMRNGIPWRLMAEHAGGGLMLDVGCHTLDILDFLLGQLLAVQGEASRRKDAPYRVEDHVAAQWRWASGGLGQGMWNMASDIFRDEVKICGERGELRFAVFGDDPIVLRIDGHEQAWRMTNPDPIQQPLIEHIVAELQGEGRSPSRGENALRVARVMDTMLQSYYEGREDAFWMRDNWGYTPILSQK
jgi:1,5-anhydro-D-fructose reductase (1,5-anhydro-D-mannitol-forming)